VFIIYSFELTSADTLVFIPILFSPSDFHCVFVIWTPLFLFLVFFIKKKWFCGKR